MSGTDFTAEIFNRYYLDLKRYLSLKFTGEQDHEDVIQDAFHNILKGGNAQSLENPKAYLYQTARNIALNRIRNQLVRNKYLEGAAQEEVASQSVDEIVHAQYEVNAVASVLSKLPAKDRQTFLLNRVDGLSYKAIAKQQNISVSTVEKRMMKVLAVVRKALDHGAKGRGL